MPLPYLDALQIQSKTKIQTKMKAMYFKTKFTLSVIKKTENQIIKVYKDSIFITNREDEYFDEDVQIALRNAEAITEQEFKNYLQTTIEYINSIA